MADENAPVRKHLTAAAEHLAAISAARDEHHKRVSEHLQLLRERHPRLPERPQQEAMK